MKSSESISERNLSPEMLLMAEMVLAAKGVERTMAQFAEATGINASTLSRLVNGNLKRPLTMDMLTAIIDNKCPSYKLRINRIDGC